MAYRLRRTESTKKGLRRIATKALEGARVRMRRSTPPSDEAIHDARKRLKKARAIMQLIEADGGSGEAGCRKWFRTANRTLSTLRDADAMIGTLAKLRKRTPSLFSEHTFARLKRGFSSHKKAAMDAADRDGAWPRVDKALRRLRRAAARWKPRHKRFGALARGIRSAHRRGRKALSVVRESGSAADFHQWRKAIKTLWYELRLIDRCGPRIRRDIAALDRAERAIGDDHNVVVLCAELSKNAIGAESIDLDRLRIVANRHQRVLRKKALASARRIYARKSDAYARGIKRAWKAWRRRTGSARSRRTPRAAA